MACFPGTIPGFTEIEIQCDQEVAERSNLLPLFTTGTHAA